MSNSREDLASKEADWAPTGYVLSPSLVALDDKLNAGGEAFRALRTHIMARHVEEGRRALAICAPAPAVGCTFVAANLAVGLSQIGVKTLLVDANLRDPSINRLFQPSAPVNGLQQCLSQQDMRFADYIQPEVLPNLSVLFAGGTPQNSQELLATECFSSLMNVCLRDYELTVLDTPPANTCSDGLRVSSVAGYALIVAKRNHTFIGDIRTQVTQLESDRARVIGTVMTGA